MNYRQFRDQAIAGRERKISHDEAKEIALRLIAGSFGEHQNPEKRPRFSIPCRPWDDDDCLIIEYIKQQASRSPQGSLEARQNG